MRTALIAILATLLQTACTSVPRPFVPDPAASTTWVRAEKTDLTVAPPVRMPVELGQRLAAALAVELQSYGVLAVVHPEEAPMRLGGVMSSRDVEAGIEIEIAWYVERDGRTEGPAISRVRTQPADFTDATDRLVSRIAQQAAPRVATLMGRPPNFEPRSPGQVAAGITLPPELAPVPPPVPSSVAAGTQAAATAPSQKAGAVPLPPSQPPAQQVAAPPPTQVKAMVAPVTGAPSDGNRQLFSGMRRALGSSKIVLSDRPGTDTFTVVGAVTLTPLDDRFAQLVIKWLLKDPSGKEVGDLEQSNRVPLAATRGSWAGFGDVVATAAAEGILDLLDKALNRPR